MSNALLIGAKRQQAARIEGVPTTPRIVLPAQACRGGCCTVSSPASSSVPWTPTPARRRDRRHLARSELATLPVALHRNLLTRVPKATQSFVATIVRSIFAQPDAGKVAEQHAGVVLRSRSASRRLRRSSPKLLPICSTSPASPGALAPALIEPCARAAEQGEPPTDGHRRHLPRPRPYRLPGRHDTRRAAR